MNKEKIRTLASEMGFSACGFTSTEPLEMHRNHLQDWLDKGFHAEMQYMENHFEKRINPSLLVEGSKTVITLLYSYAPSQRQREDSYHVAKYAYGEDYHTVFKQKMQELFDTINRHTPISGRVFTDSAPLLERPLAVRSGLGWIGKNSLLITKEFGSLLFIGEIVVDLELEPDEPFANNHCGTCRRCIESCPNQAITENRSVDSNRCISYLTIEHRGEFPSEQSNLANNIFGCDICQDVCPWNRSVPITTEPKFTPHEDMLTFSKEQWENITEEQYREMFRRSAVKRTKYSGLTRNISAVKKQS